MLSNVCAALTVMTSWAVVCILCHIHYKLPTKNIWLFLYSSHRIPCLYYVRQIWSCMRANVQQYFSTEMHGYISLDAETKLECICSVALPAGGKDALLQRRLTQKLIHISHWSIHYWLTHIVYMSSIRSLFIASINSIHCFSTRWSGYLVWLCNRIVRIIRTTSHFSRVFFFWLNWLSFFWWISIKERVY